MSQRSTLDPSVMKRSGNDSSRRGANASRAIKRSIDIVGAAAGLLATGPIVAGAALAVRATMGPPVLFRQPRPGLHGRPFELLKLRTMRPLRPGESSEDDEGARIPRLGWMLRSWSLDELPSLWNVLRGDMSLVGPRPLLMEYLERYTPEQARRHHVKPGLTGWAQINGRNARDWEEKFALDTWYADHWSIGLDLWILLRTPLTVLRREGVSHHSDSTSPVFHGSAKPPIAFARRPGRAA